MIAKLTSFLDCFLAETPCLYSCLWFPHFAFKGSTCPLRTAKFFLYFILSVLQVSALLTQRRGEDAVPAGLTVLVYHRILTYLLSGEPGGHWSVPGCLTFPTKDKEVLAGGWVLLWWRKENMRAMLSREVSKDFVRRWEALYSSKLSSALRPFLKWTVFSCFHGNCHRITHPTRDYS